MSTLPGKPAGWRCLVFPLNVQCVGFLLVAASLALPAAGIAAPFAYISGNSSNQVKVIDTATNIVTATVPVGNGPLGVAVTPNGAKVYVANGNSNNVSVINTATNTVVATIGVGALPWGVAVAPDGSRAYVANRLSASVSVINTATDTVIATIPIGANPLELDVSPDGTRVYVTRTGAGGLAVINATTNTLLTTVATTGGYTAGVIVIPQGTKAYVTHYRVLDGGSPTVSVVSTASNTEISTIPVDLAPWAITTSPDGTRVYVSHQDSSTVKVINTATDTVTATVTGFSQPIGVSCTPDGSRLYVAELGSTNARVVNTATNTITATVPLGMSAISVGRFIVPPSPLCGNGLVQVGEQCDDGNGTNGDGCDNNCTVTGCGNGITTSGEQCDDANLIAGDCCSATCQYEASGSPCAADINECTDDECDGAGTCMHPNSVLGTPCTPDGNVCTDDECDGAGGCGVPNIAPCDDTIFCNGADTCNGGACTQNAGNPCPGHDVGPSCNDSCTEAGGGSCTAADVSGTSCDDGLFCTAIDTCDGAGTCVGSGNPCPGHNVGPNCNDSCTEAGGGSCTAADTDGTGCADGLFCTGADTCSGGACSGHTGDPCTGGPDCADACNEAADNCLEPSGTACTDDGNACTDDECNGAGACTHPNNTDPCDDDLFCTGADTCSGGACSHAGDPCDGGLECADVCNEGADNCFEPSGTACTADGNVCTDDECNGAGACAHPDNTDSCDDGLFCNGADTCGGGSCSTHAGDPCPGPDGDGNCAESCDEAGDACTLPDPNGGSCTDGDPCTVGETCTAGSCGGGTLDPAGCIDHYLCYKAKETSGTPKFIAVPGVSLIDQFDVVTAEVRKPKAICPPADKNGEGVLDEDTHALSYQVKATPAHLPQTDIEVIDQFGTLHVDTVKLDRLFVPTTKGLGGPPVPPVAGVADHYTCYKVKVTPGTPKFPKGIQASVVDQFQTRVYDVGKPRRLCVPVDKNGEGLVNEAAHLMCYKVKPASGEPKHTRVIGQIHTENQFGALRLDTVKEEVLCVPAEKIP
jgi:YVTN family beta-propeller protein